MKKISIILSALVFAAFLVTSCSKDQKSVNRLEGEWEITSMSYDGEAADKEEYEGLTYTFEKCKTKKGDCPGTMTFKDPDKGDQKFPFTYNVTEKGTKLTIKMLTESTVWTISDQTKTTIKLEATDGGVKTVMEMKKK